MTIRTRPAGAIEQAALATSLACIVDVETTGLSPYSDEIVQLALVLFGYIPQTGDMGDVVDEYVGLRQPSCPIPSEVVAIHGLDDAAVRGCSLDSARVSSIIGRAKLLIAHNAPFDRGFVTRLFPEARQKPWFCTMRGIDWPAKGFATRRLPDLLAGHNIRPSRHHRADFDAKATVALLGRPGYLLELLNSYPL